MEITEPKPKDYLESADYLNLKKEIAAGVDDALGKGGEPIDFSETLLEFVERSEAYNPSRPIREKLFWEIVAEAFRKQVFPAIVEGTKESGEVSQSDVNKKIREAIKKLGLRSMDQRNFAFIIIRQYFYKAYPELERPIIKSRPPETKSPKVMVGDDFVRDFSDVGVMGGGTWPELNKAAAKESRPQYIDEKNWEVPGWEEIKPGLIVELKDMRELRIRRMLILSKPEKRAIGTYIRARELDNNDSPQSEPDDYILASFGVIPYKSGVWSNWLRPVRWYMKKSEAK